MNPTARWRRLLAHLALGLLLLGAQQHGMGHWLSHAIDATHAKAPGSPSHPHCADCDGLIALAAALPGGSVATPLLPAIGESVPAAPLRSLRDALAPAAYRSRAPPARR